MAQEQSHQEIRGIHRLPLYGAFAVVVLSLILVVTFVASGAKPVGTIETSSLMERHLLFRDGNHGQLLVYDASTRRRIGRFDKGEGAFVRISMRSLNRHRIHQSISLSAPYRLVKSSDGNLFIIDPQSEQKIRVSAFGPIAIESFSRFLKQDVSHKRAGG